jgi:aryl-alcohol dehydrogenase-like predicted oxidoreductase
MLPRSLGRSGVSLSPLAFGSMRMNERSLDDAAWESLLRHSRELGVTTFHASGEYESHARFCGVFGRLDRRGTQVIVKLAEPHFGDAAFDEARFEAKLDAYLRELGVDRIDVVQWMWRGDLKDEPGRLVGFARQREQIRGAFERARQAGKMGAVAPFPYTAGFCDATIDAGLDGITVYLNPVEREMVPQIARAHAAGIGTVAIRPLSAGKALATANPAACIRSVLGEPGVATAVVTYSSPEHIAELVQATKTIRAV